MEIIIKKSKNITACLQINWWISKQFINKYNFEKKLLNPNI